MAHLEQGFHAAVAQVAEGRLSEFLIFQPVRAAAFASVSNRQVTCLGRFWQSYYSILLAALVKLVKHCAAW